MAAEEGKKAPSFTLVSDSGEKVSLASLRGKNVVLYFYPKDDTPGCTREACAFRDTKAKLARLDAVVVGVSPDPVPAHEKFKKKHKLNFVLLSDPDHAVAEKYDAWGKKVLYGKEHEGILRSTFLIDAEGVVRKAWRKVKVDGHDAQVLDALRELEKAILRPFHLAFPVRDLAAARAFYGDLLGCREGRASDTWVDFDFHGHQISAHLAPAEARGAATNVVDGDDVPVRHFGLVLAWDEWHALAERLRARGARFRIEPHVRFGGQVGEQATFFLDDPSGNALEFKAFRDESGLFAR